MWCKQKFTEAESVEDLWQEADESEEEFIQDEEISDKREMTSSRCLGAMRTARGRISF